MIEPLAALLRDAELQIRGEQTYPAIAEWLIAHGVTMGPASPVRPDPQGTFRTLLEEWLATPFFERREDWQRWVDDFGFRVQTALDRNPSETPGQFEAQASLGKLSAELGRGD